MNKLLILSENAEEYAQLLRSRELPELEIAVASAPDQAALSVDEAQIILGKPGWVAPLLESARQLQWVQSIYAGVEPFCEPGRRTDYLLTGVKDVFGPHMSEYVFAYILALERNLFALRENQREKLWQGIPYRGLAGLTIGICGLGSIGRHLAETAHHFKMRVLGLSRSAAATPYVEKVFKPSEICELAGQVDYLVVVLPKTRETEGIIDERVIRVLGRSAVLINVGRGASIDEPALVKALENEQIRAAVLDVFNAEPLPKESPLWRLENAYVTPHNSAVSFPKDIVDIFCENYQRFRSDQTLKFVIQFDRGF